MKYEVKDELHGIISTHRSKRAAIKAAKSASNPERTNVIAHETSGTYESRQQIWPTQGVCYSN